jgi:hypothetical protein
MSSLFLKRSCNNKKRYQEERKEKRVHKKRMDKKSEKSKYESERIIFHKWG